MHSLVVGPGLGRSFSLMSPAKIIVNKAMEMGIPLVIDADGIYLVSCDPDLIQGLVYSLKPRHNGLMSIHQVVGNKNENN